MLCSRTSKDSMPLRKLMLASLLAPRRAGISADPRSLVRIQSHECRAVCVHGHAYTHKHRIAPQHYSTPAQVHIVINDTLATGVVCKYPRREGDEHRPGGEAGVVEGEASVVGGEAGEARGDAGVAFGGGEDVLSIEGVLPGEGELPL